MKNFGLIALFGLLAATQINAQCACETTDADCLSECGKSPLFLALSLI